MHKLTYEDLAAMLATAEEKVPVGTTWRHYKGQDYIVKGLAVAEATDEVVVLYTPCDRPEVTFSRPLVSWLETIIVDYGEQARFAKLS